MADVESMTLSQNLVQALDNLNGVHPGQRPAHAKGMMFSGTFTPAPDAGNISKARHFQGKPTPVTVRLSDSAGVPDVADNDPNAASPRGFAVRFHLKEHVHTDIVSHSHNGFAVRTPEEFLEFLRAIASSGPDVPKPSPIQLFLGAHPSALRFVQAPKPIPASFANEAFFAVNAFKFTNQDGQVNYGRYRIVPELGVEHLDAATAAGMTGNFLFDDIARRVASGAVKFKLMLQLAASGDPTDDATIQWPDDRKQVELGTIALTAVAGSEDRENRRLIFDPIPRVEGIEPSGDPLLAVRADVYLLSGRRRRAALGDATEPGLHRSAHGDAS